MANETEQSSDGVKVNRGKLGSISVFEITEDELDLLERGSPTSTYLNFSIALISASISFFITIFSTTIEDIRTYAIFWIVALVTAILGIVLFVVWWRASRGVKSLYKRIRGRLVSNTTTIVEPVEIVSETSEVQEEKS